MHSRAAPLLFLHIYGGCHKLSPPDAPGEVRARGDGAADAPEDVLHHVGLRKWKAAGMARSPAGFDQAYLTGRRR